MEYRLLWIYNFWTNEWEYNICCETFFICSCVCLWDVLTIIWTKCDKFLVVGLGADTMAAVMSQQPTVQKKQISSNWNGNLSLPTPRLVFVGGGGCYVFTVFRSLFWCPVPASEFFHFAWTLNAFGWNLLDIVTTNSRLRFGWNCTGDMGTCDHGNMATWEHVIMGTWRDGNMATWEHVIMGTWHHGDMGTCHHGKHKVHFRVLSCKFF